MDADDRRPLEGIRVIDAGVLIGGPFSAELLGDFGAEVIKIEHPGTGDPVRELMRHEGTSLRWKILGRNKKSVTLNLGTEEGQEIFKTLVADADVLVESFSPGTLESWNVGWETLSDINPSLVMLRVSGFGQDGPNSDRTGFGRFGEAFSGFTHLNGAPDSPPQHPELALGDYVTGLMGWGAIMTALYARGEDGSGQCIDLGLYESVFRLMEFMLIEYDQTGTVRERSGNPHRNVVPSNVYESKDGEYVTFAGGTQSIVERLFEAMGRPELIDDERFETNADRLEHREELEEIVSAWFGSHTFDEIEEISNEYDLPFSPIMDAERISDDDHYEERENIVEVEDEDLGTVSMQGIIPKFSESTGEVKWTGPALGAHTEEVLREELGIDAEEFEELREKDVV